MPNFQGFIQGLAKLKSRKKEPKLIYLHNNTNVLFRLFIYLFILPDSLSDQENEETEYEEH